MTDSLPNARYERKFVACGVSLADVLALIHRHPALFRETYPARMVNSLYLDTPALGDYLAHVHGTANRVKTRIRWYGPLSGPVAAPNLERKIKRGVVSGKLTYSLAPLTVNGSVSPRELEASLAGGGLPERMRAELRHLKPALVNRYRRHYFESADGRVRLTADADLQFHGVRHATGTLAPALAPTSGVILELKYEPRHSDRAAVIANGFPFRLTRCSKYVLGVERLHGCH